MSDHKSFLEQYLGPYKDHFAKWLENSVGISLTNIEFPLAVTGMHFVPQILINEHLHVLADVAGAGVATFTFLTAAQVWGKEGVFLWATVYGIGAVVSSFVIMLK